MDLTCCRLPLTDLGNAERWRVRFGADFRFCAEIGWFAWDQMRWKLLSEEKDSVPAEVIWSITRTVRAIRNEAALVAASGCEEPNPPLGPAQKHRFSLLRERVLDEGWERYTAMAGKARDALGPRFRGDDEEGCAAAVGDWIDGLEPMDALLDLAKEKLFSTAVLAWARKSEAAGTVGGTVRWIKGFRDIVVRPDAFDRDRMAINVANGTLRVVRNTVKLSDAERQARIASGKEDRAFETRGWKVKRTAHDRADLITKLAPVRFAPAARCPEYDAFLERVQPDETMRRFVHQWFGYSLTGDIGEHKMAFFHGGGRNGKGTAVELMAHISGDYAGSVGFDSLAAQEKSRRGDQATPDIARLPGVRFLRVSEPPKGVGWNDGLLKQLTGGDPVDARHLHKGFFTFLPDFKITVSGNTKPKGRDISHGFWSRMQLVPWEVTIPEDEIDTDLGEKLRAEASGVLNRLIEGLLDWMEHGLIVPEQVREATRAYRDDSDDLGRFLSAICEVGGDPTKVRVGARFLWQLYTNWAEHAGGAKVGEAKFKQGLEEKGFVQIQSDGMKWQSLRPKPGVMLDDVERGVWPGVGEAKPQDGASASGDAPEGSWPSGESGDWEPDDWAPPEEQL